MKKFFLALIFTLLLFLALIPRSVEIFNHNYLFLFDQGREYLAAKNIIVNHKFILIGTELGAGSAGISGIFHGPIYYYLLTIPFMLFHGDPYGGVVLMFLFSLSSIIAGYFLGKKMWGYPWGIFVAFFFAISPPLIAQARFIWSPNPPTVFVVLAFFFVYRFIKQKKSWDIFWAAFFSGFVYNFEFALAIPMVLNLIVFLLLLKQKTTKLYLFLLAGILVAFLPMILFESRHHFLAIHGVLSYIFSHKASKTHETFLTTLNSHWWSFFANAADTFPQRGFLSGVVLFFLFILFSSWNVIKEKNKILKLFITYLLFLLPITILVFSFLRNTVYPYYLTDVTVAYIFLFTYCFYSFWRRKEKILTVIFIMYAGILLIGGIISAVYTWNHDIHDFGGTAKNKGIEQALDYIYTDAHNKQFGVLVFAPPVYTYQYDYMLWWYGERKYHYIPYKQKKGLVYLLIEPDPSKPWSYQGWLQTVIKTGRVLQTKTLFPSGFIVQKRKF